MDLCRPDSKTAADESKLGWFPCGGLCGAVIFLVGVITLTLWFVMGQPQSPSNFWNEFQKEFGLSEGQQPEDKIWSDRDIHSDISADPFVGDNTTTAWSPDIIIVTNGFESNGQAKLRLEILNALDDAWQEDFQLVVSDWQAGASDINLELVVTRVEVDPTCTPIEGVIKVCNSDFGPTDWVGINDARVFYAHSGAGKSSPGYIISSVAKMNDYYLLETSQAARQHAMCHELGTHINTGNLTLVRLLLFSLYTMSLYLYFLGHSLGLPHTDENPFNKDLGNCMDYTNAPENNLHPGQVNFQRLASIYKDFWGTDGSSKNQQEIGNKSKPHKLRALR